MIVTVSQRERHGEQPKHPDAAWQERDGLFVPSFDAPSGMVTRWSEWMSPFATVRVHGTVETLAATLLNADEYGDLAVSALGLAYAEQWITMGVAQITTTAALISQAEDELIAGNSWPVDDTFMLLKRAFAEGALGGRLWIGDLRNATQAA